jgi:hypothetical protein
MVYYSTSLPSLPFGILCKFVGGLNSYSESIKTMDSFLPGMSTMDISIHQVFERTGCADARGKTASDGAGLHHPGRGSRGGEAQRRAPILNVRKKVLVVGAMSSL